MKNSPTNTRSLAFGQLAASLANYPGTEPLRMLALIGASADAGTTTVAMNLGRTQAKNNESVLLITLTQTHGYNAHITRAEDIAQQAQKLAENFYHVQIPAAVLPLATGKNDRVFEALLADLRQRYDHVMWDTMAVSESPESAAICKHTQGVVLVVHAGKTRWFAARHTIDVLRFAGARMLGIVLNKKKVYIPDALYRFLFRYGF